LKNLPHMVFEATLTAYGPGVSVSGNQSKVARKKALPARSIVYPPWDVKIDINA
jgi:hypothetical protein